MYQRRLDPHETIERQRELISSSRLKVIAWFATAATALGAAGFTAYKSYNPSDNYDGLVRIDRQEKNMEARARLKEKLGDAWDNYATQTQNFNTDHNNNDPDQGLIMESVDLGNGRAAALPATLRGDQREELSDLNENRILYGFTAFFLLAAAGGTGIAGRSSLRQFRKVNNNFLAIWVDENGKTNGINRISGREFDDEIRKYHRQKALAAPAAEASDGALLALPSAELDQA